MKTRRHKASGRVPLSWRIISVLAMLPLAAGIFSLIFKKSGGKLPLAAGDSTDPIFFSFIFAVLLPFILYALVIDKILRAIVQKRSAKNVAVDIAKDVAEAVVINAIDAVVGSSGSSSSGGSSSRGGTKGGGGDFGGGGASGGY